MIRILLALAAFVVIDFSLFAQTQLVSDNFTGTAGAPLGSNWTGCGNSGGSMTKLYYQTGGAGGGGYSSQECAAYTGYGAFPSNQYATATVAAATPSAIAQAGIQIRQNATPSTAASYIACGWNAHDFTADSHYRIWSLSPTGSPVSLYLSTVTPASGDVVWCQVLGVTVTMKVNGSVIGTVTDTSGVTGGYPGLYYIDPNSGAPPSSDVMWSNFAAGAGASLVSLTITPSSSTVIVGSFEQFSGTATYADGTTASMNSWTSSNPSVVSIDPTGLSYAATPSAATITGATGLDSGTAAITVSGTVLYTPLVSDSFYVASSSYGSYLGSNWTGCGWASGAYSKLVYQAHDAGGGGYSAQECAVYTGYGAFPNDQYATATVVSPSPTSSTQAAVVVRQNATASTPESYISCGWNYSDFHTAPDIGNSHYRIWSMQPNPPTGGPTSLYISTVTPQTGDVVWCQALGSTVTMKVNGSVLATVTDTSGVASGYPGLYYIDPTSGPPTSSDVIWSNFVAGAGPPLASLTIAPSSATVTQGSFFQFAATATYADGTTATPNLTWSSSNSSAATVNASGLAYGVSSGSTTITGTYGSITGTTALSVAAGQVTPSTAQTLVTSDPFLNLGSATTVSYTAPGTSAGTGLVPLASATSNTIWLIYPNPWGVTAGSGTITTNYTGSGSIAATINLTGLPASGVDGSPFALYGCDQYGDCSATGQPLQFPKQLSTMSSLVVDYSYALSGSINGSRDIDQIWDEWVCPASTGGGINTGDSPNPCLEVEILPYFSFVDGGIGTLARTFTVPAIVNGASTTISFDEYLSLGNSDGSNDILFYPHTLPGISSASLRFDFLPFFKQAVVDSGNPAFQWLMGMEPGTEFGANAAQSYALTITKLDFEQTLASAARQPIMSVVM
jgi:Bacterial Ig-like domain (group 2)